MTIFIIIILVAIFLVGLGFGAVVWFIYRRRQLITSKKPAEQITAREKLSFRWSYIILPVAILILSIVLTAVFYPRLPAEVAYRFTFSGSPDKWLSREMIAVWALVPQFVLALLAGGITWGVTRAGILSAQADVAWIKPQRILWFMGNMVALPQIVLCFAMLDIFSYNSYQIHLMPVWIFAVIIMGVGGIILGVFFIQAVRRAWGTIGQASR